MSSSLSSFVSSSIYEGVSRHLKIPFKVAKYVLHQVDQGATVPFLARYRRDETGNLDEKVIRSIIDVAASAKEVERRRSFMMQSLTERQLLTPAIAEEFKNITQIDVLEDAWEAYKVRKTSLASRGREQGLCGEKLLLSAEPISNLSRQIKEVKDAEKLYTAIIVEEVSRNMTIRKEVLKYVEATGKINANLVKNARKDKAKSLQREQFEKLKQMFLYYDGKSWPIAAVKSHIVLALQRGEEKGVLQVNVTCGLHVESIFRRQCLEQFPFVKVREENHGSSLECKILKKGLSSACAYLTSASYKSVRRDLKQRAEEKAIDVFSTNLRHLLLQKPLTKARILAMDPGLANGVKCVVLNEDGNLLTTLKCSVLDEGPMKRQVCEMVEKHQVNKIVIGNGTASQRTTQVVAQLIAEKGWKNVEFAIVSETGASVYSASDAAKEEFPHLDILYRGAVSIGRRVLDPLSELVKIPVKSMGIGMYQHDVNEKKLIKALSETVESCVASVGINAAVSNKYVMEKIPGITKPLVHQIILARHANRLRNREDFRRVPGMVEGIYAQIAGFFRFPNSAEPLDNTVLLPEWYEFVRRLAALYREKDFKNRKENLLPSSSADNATRITSSMTISGVSSPEDPHTTSSQTLTKIGQRLAQESSDSFRATATEIGCGVECLRLIEKELLHPGMDPRSSLPHAGFMRTKLIDVKELVEGDVLKGVVQSVTTFGAFVDCGLEQSVLVKGLGMDRTHPGALLDNLIFTGKDHLGRPQVRCNHGMNPEGFACLSDSRRTEKVPPAKADSSSLTSSIFSPSAASLSPKLMKSGTEAGLSLYHQRPPKRTHSRDEPRTTEDISGPSVLQQNDEDRQVQKKMKREDFPSLFSTNCRSYSHENEEEVLEL